MNIIDNENLDNKKIGGEIFMLPCCFHGLTILYEGGEINGK